MHHRLVYGLDIETNASLGSGDPLDPLASPVRTAVLSTARGDSTFRGDEDAILDDLDEALRNLEPGILATWNGGAFDLPYLADRASMWGLHLGLRLASDPRLRRRGDVLRGHTGAYRAAWYDHRHLDAARLFRSGWRPLLEVDGLLRSIGLRVGTARHELEGPSGAPGAELHHEAEHAYASNDARLVRTLVERRLPAATRAPSIAWFPPELHQAGPARRPGSRSPVAARPARGSRRRTRPCGPCSPPKADHRPSALSQPAGMLCHGAGDTSCRPPVATSARQVARSSATTRR